MVEQDLAVPAVVVIEGVLLALEVGHPEGRSAAAIVVGCIHAHAAGRAALAITSRAAPLADFLEPKMPRRTAVHVKQVARLVIADINVWLAIAVHVHG